MSRRDFVSASVALPSALQSLAEPPPAKNSWVLLGTDKGAGIYRARWNAATGAIGKPELAIATGRPAFFAMHPTLPVLYTANELSGKDAAVSSFRVHRATAELELINSRETHGDSPCTVSVDRTGQSAFAANYSGGSMTAFRLSPDGGLAQTVGVFRYNQAKHGPVADRQDASHIHSSTVSPNNDFVLACDLGDDVILVFPVAPDQNSYVGGPTQVAARPGSGPRHVAFHPNGKWVYCIHELDCTIDLYDWRTRGKSVGMTLRDGSIVSTIKPSVNLTGNTAAEVVISNDGLFLYACTRGENTLSVYSIDQTSGLLTQEQHLSCGGAVPRYFGFDPSQRWLVCTNQEGGSLTVFARNAQTGHLTPKAKKVAAESPMFILWL